MRKLLLLVPLALVVSAPAKPSGAAPASAGSCSVVGTWTGSYSCPALAGRHYTWIIHPDGTASGSIAGLGPIQQTWKYAKGTLTIEERRCPGEGRYTVSFPSGCGTMKLARLGDGCESRGPCVDGLVSTRQH